MEFYCRRHVYYGDGIRQTLGNSSIKLYVKATEGSSRLLTFVSYPDDITYLIKSFLQTFVSFFSVVNLLSHCIYSAVAGEPKFTADR